MSSTRPGNQNRGWNDPPEILHSATENGKLVLNSQRNILNKRVAHNFTDSKPVDKDPNSSTPTQAISNPTLAVPPTTSDQLAEEQLQLIDSTSNQSDETVFSSESSLEFIEKVFSEKLDYIKSKSIANKIVDDLAKRIKIFSNSWSKLSLTVKENMLKLAQALNNDELNKADDLHLKLVLDYPSEVMQWMVGIKKLIHEMKQIPI